jgi:hypothetical protein
MKKFGYLVIIKLVFWTSLEKLQMLKSGDFVNILATFLCPSFTRLTHVLLLRNITASLICGLWLKWQTSHWLSDWHAETLKGHH